MAMILWAIFNLILAIMTIFGSHTAGTWLAYSILVGWVVAIIVQIAKD